MARRLSRLASLMAIVAFTSPTMADDIVDLRWELVSNAWITQSGLDREGNRVCSLTSPAKDEGTFTYQFTEGAHAPGVVFDGLSEWHDPTERLLGSFEVDGTSKQPISVAYLGRLLMIYWPDQPALLPLMAAGNEFTVKVGDRNFTVDLQGAQAAVIALDKCLKQLGSKRG